MQLLTKLPQAYSLLQYNSTENSDKITDIKLKKDLQMLLLLLPINSCLPLSIQETISILLALAKSAINIKTLAQNFSVHLLSRRK